MIIALQLGRGGSTGFPGKNTHKVLGRPLMEYPLLAAKQSKYVDDIFVSTDSDEIKEIGRANGAKIIDRPEYLCTKEALHSDAMVHGYHYVKDLVDEKIELIVLIQCNAPFVLPDYIDEGIEKLREDISFDSAVTVSKYNMFSPARARTVDRDGSIGNFVPVEFFTRADSITCDKDSQGDVYYADGLFIVRPYCLDHMNEGMLPYRWMGKKSYAIQNWGGLDVDYAWQVPQVEFWLKKHGFTDQATPYDNKGSRNINLKGKEDGEHQEKAQWGGNHHWNVADDWKHINFRDSVSVRFRMGYYRPGAYWNCHKRCA